MIRGNVAVVRHGATAPSTQSGAVLLELSPSRMRDSGWDQLPPDVRFAGAGTPSTYAPWVAAFVQRLRELGWVEGRTIAIEYRWAEGRNERYAENAAEFVRLKVDVIVTSTTPPTLAAKQSTAVIPIVFAAANDPVGTGLVASLARPGGNVTGLANQISDTSGKKLEFLREVVPGLRRLAIMANAD